MQLDFTTNCSKAEAYRWLASTVTPRPIAWVSTLSKEGQSNLAPFSFFQVISDSPPTLLVNTSLRDDGSVKDTLRNVRETGELVIHLVSAAQAEAMNATAAWLPHGVSEIEHGQHPHRAQRACCSTSRRGRAGGLRMPVGGNHAVPGGKPLEHPDLRPRAAGPYRRCRAAGRTPHGPGDRLDLVGRLGGTQYSYTRDTFSMIRPK